MCAHMRKRKGKKEQLIFSPLHLSFFWRSLCFLSSIWLLIRCIMICLILFSFALCHLSGCIVNIVKLFKSKSMEMKNMELKKYLSKLISSGLLWKKCRIVQRIVFWYKMFNCSSNIWKISCLVCCCSYSFQTPSGKPMWLFWFNFSLKIENKLLILVKQNVSIRIDLCCFWKVRISIFWTDWEWPDHWFVLSFVHRTYEQHMENYLFIELINDANWRNEFDLFVW